MAPSRIKAIFGIAGVVFLSKILGLFREMVIADRFGTSAEYDLYLIAIILPALAYGVVNFASYYLFVPYLTRAFEHSEDTDQSRGWRAAWPLLNAALLAALIITLLMILSAPWLMKIWAGGYSPEQYATIIFYSRLTALMVLLGTSEAFLRAILNVKKIFTYPAAGPIIFNLLSILCIVVLAGRISVGAIAVGLLVGLFIQNVYLFLRLITFKVGKTYRFVFTSEELKALWATAGVLLLIELLNRSYFMIDRYFAPRFGEGIVAALNYSQVLVQLPDAVVGFAIASVLFPLFSKSDYRRIADGGSAGGYIFYQRDRNYSSYFLPGGVRQRLAGKNRSGFAALHADYRGAFYYLDLGPRLLRPGVDPKCLFVYRNFVGK